VAFLERHPALKKALANQYQVILVGGAAALSGLLMNPLPLLVLAGAELVTLPWIVERLKRRMDLERKLARRTAKSVTQEEQYRELPSPLRARFLELKATTERIQDNYRGLAPETQGMLADQSEKLEAILVSCLRRLWLLRRYEDLARTLDEDELRTEVEALKARVETAEDVEERVLAAWRQNLDIKQRVLETAERNRATQATLLAELDSIESLLQLLLQKSLAASDAASFSAEVDDALSQAEADERTVHEMEQLVGAEPMASRERLSESLRTLSAAPHVPASGGSRPPPLRSTERRR
jgi:hypothetical protein